MKRKKVLRIAFLFVYWSVFVGVIAFALRGEINTFGYMLIGFYSGSIVIQIFSYTFNRINYRYLFESYKEVYDCLKISHNTRYQYYLNGKKDDIEEWTEVVNMCADALLVTGDILRDDKRALKKERKEVQEIMDKSKVLMTTIIPSA